METRSFESSRDTRDPNTLAISLGERFFTQTTRLRRFSTQFSGENLRFQYYNQDHPSKTSFDIPLNAISSRDFPRNNCFFGDWRCQCIEPIPSNRAKCSPHM